ncbi:MAG TPA: helix-turn-helix domain-containing protein [Pedobacter sp.]|nr:helix-turn-helix domain-containing protein [Pedobacter sp.]
MLTLNIFTIVNLVLLSLLMGVRKVNTTANKLLAVIIVLPAFTFLVNYLTAIDFVSKMPILLGFNVSFLWAPVILWYVKLMLKQQVHIHLGKLIHAVPMLINIAYGLYLVEQSPAYLTTLSENLRNYIFPWQIEALNALIMFQLIGYLVYSLYLVRKWKAEEGQHELMSIKIKWLNQFLIVLFGLSLLLGFSHLFFTPVEVDYYVAPGLYNIFYFWVVYQSFSSSGIFADFTYNINIKEEIISKEKYLGSALKQEHVEQYKKILIGHMETSQPYRDPELSLSGLASDTGIPAHHLSQMINQEFGKNFFDFVNMYRIDKAKELMKDKATGNLTLEAIGAVSGFGSATAFYRAFKKHTGITPSSYLKNLNRPKTTTTL